MVEVDGFLVNPPKEKSCGVSHSFFGDISLMVVFKLRILTPSTDPFKGFS
jgi:hypothetical protein